MLTWWEGGEPEAGQYSQLWWQLSDLVMTDVQRVKFLKKPNFWCKRMQIVVGHGERLQSL